jgi:phosphonate ABC transporter, ATP-binding protein
MLELKNVTHHFHKDEPVLKQVSLQIAEGEFVAVIGRSGAGKTTLLKLFNAMVRPQQGTVWVDGQCLSRCSGKKLRQIQQKIAVIYQDFCLVDQSTALENVLHGALYRCPFWRVMTGCFSEQDNAKAKEALAKVGLAEKADALVSTLSGGEKQRVAIARAMMQQARVILADEPVASLDPVAAEQVLSLLKSLQQEEKLTVLMNSHNTLQAAQYAERIIGLKQGTIVKDAPVSAWDEESFAAVYGDAK